MNILLLAFVAYFFSTSAAIEVWLGAALVPAMPLGIFLMLAMWAWSPVLAQVLAWAGVIVLTAKVVWGVRDAYRR